MKKTLAMLLAVLMIVSLLPISAFAATDSWAVRLNVSENTSVKYNEMNTLEVGFGVQSDNLSLKTIQSVLFAVDLNVFDFVTKAGALSMDTPGSTTMAKWNSIKYVYSKYSDMDDDYTEWNVDVYYGVSGTTGYIMIQPSQNNADEFLPTEQNLGSILLGFKSGKSKDDLTTDSIRFATVAEAEAWNQTFVVLLTDGKAGGEKQYFRKTDSTGDELSVTPVVNWGTIEVKLPALTGTPTISGTAEFGATLNAGTTALPTDAGTLSYQWYRGDTAIAGATAATYTLTADDIGSAIKVAVSATNYSGSVTSDATANVAAKSLAGAAVSPTSPFDTYDGTEKKPSVTVTVDGTTLIEGTDYTLSCLELCKAAKSAYTFTITGIGSYTGTKDIPFTINKAEVTKELFDYSLTAVDYSGVAQPVTVTPKSGIEGVGSVTVKYNGSTTAPKDAGNYTVSISVADDGTNYQATSSDIELGMYTINKVALTPSVATVSDKTYDGTAAATGTVTLTGAKNGETPAAAGTFTWVSANAGTDKVNVTLTLGTEWTTNYELSTYSVSNVDAGKSIQPKELTITGVAATNRAYNGSTSVDLTGGALSGVITDEESMVDFTLGNGTIASADAGNGKAVTTAITLTGTGASNYTLTQPTGITVDIAKATWTDTTTSADTRYDTVKSLDLSAYIAPGATAALGTMSGPLGIFAVVPSLSGSSLNYTTSAKNETLFDQTYTVNVDVTGATNYSDYTVVVTIKYINKADADVTITGTVPTALSYGDEGFTLTASAANEGTNGAWTYTSSDTNVLAVDASGNVTVVGVGTATITVNYESDTTIGSDTTATITVDPKPITITGVTATNRNYAAGNVTVALTGGALDGVINSDDVGFALGSGTMTDANVGEDKAVTTAITLTGTKAGNYTLTQPTGITVDIAKIDPTCTAPTNLTATYGQTLADVNITAGNGTGDGTWSWTTAATTSVGTVVGPNNFKATFTPTDGTNYNTLTDIDVSVAVSKATPVITAENQSVCIGSTLDIVASTSNTEVGALAYAIVGTEPTGISISGKTITATTAAVPGTFQVKISADATANFEKPADKTITITIVNKADADVTITGTVPTALSYGDEGFTLTASAANEGTNGAWTYTSSDTNVLAVDASGNVTVVGVGTATIIAKYESDTTMDQAETATITVSKKQIAVPTLAEDTFTYDGTAKTVAIAASYPDADYVELTGDVTKTAANNYTATAAIKAAYAANVEFNSTETALAWVIEKCAVTGDPEITPITAPGKTLADAAIAPNSEWPTGTVAWLDDTDAVITDPSTVDVTANTAYKWQFTPDDTANYEVVTGTLTPYYIAPVIGPSTYIISTNDPANGTLSVSPMTAAKDAEVTITATPDAGYGLDSLEVKDSEGNKIELTDLGNGKFSFKMPAGAVSIDAAFAPSEALCDKGTECPLGKFTDLTVDMWYHDGIHYCLDAGLMNGTSDTTFTPYGTASRAMVVTTLYRIAKNEGMGFQGDWAFLLPYGDVADIPAYAYEATAWCTMKGIVGGYTDGNFGPTDPITREQFVTMLYRFAQVLGYDVSVDENTNFLSFNDFWDVSEYAKPAMMWAIENGIIEGDETGSLLPGDNANRAQMAAVLQRFCENVVK